MAYISYMADNLEGSLKDVGTWSPILTLQTSAKTGQDVEEAADLCRESTGP